MITSTHTASIRRYKKLSDFPSVNAKPMQQSPSAQIPQTDGKIHPAGHQMVFVVSRMLSVGVQQAIDPPAVSTQHLMRWPI